MKIDLFQIGNFHVRGYGFMIGLGFLLALVLGCKRAKKLELKDESVIDIAILAGSGTCTGLWQNRLLFGRLLLRTGNNRRMGYYISRRQHGADRHKAYSDTASFSSRGFFDCRNPDMDCTPFFISAEKADNRRYRQYLFTAVRYRKISD